jgi:biotin transport system substrate-specific component
VGAAYGARLGTATLALYAFEGAVGLPVFAGLSGGLAVFAGPTGGYIVGFILAAALVGWLVQSGRADSTPRLIFATLAGAALVYVPGLVWLGHFTGAAAALKFGLYPFVLGDAIKAVVAALAVPAASSLIGRRG